MGCQLVGLHKINNGCEEIIFDTCALDMHLSLLDEKPVNDLSDFVPFLVEKIEEGYKINIPNLVFDEFFYDINNLNRKKLDFGRNLARAFFSRPVFDGLYNDERKSISRDLKLFKRFDNFYHIGYVDFYILTRAKVLSQTRGSSAIVSNDISTLGSTYRRLINKTVLTPENMGFFIRKGINRFERFT